MIVYNEIEPFAAEWLRNLMMPGTEEIPWGEVDERPIQAIRGTDLREAVQFHTFAGIGGWPLALKLAGWPEDREVWTGSCPCQPFSTAGKGKGEADERHLWPDFFRLIVECRPATVFGEQVSGAAGLKWLDGVFGDLEREGYSCGATIVGAHSVGAPHIRQRIYWVADPLGFLGGRRPGEGPEAEGGSAREAREQRLRDEPGTADSLGPWSDSYLIPCTDGTARRVGRGVFPLAYGVPRDLGRGIPELRSVARSAGRNRVGRLKGYGNAINPILTAEFIKAYMETLDKRTTA